NRDSRQRLVICAGNDFPGNSSGLSICNKRLEKKSRNEKDRQEIFTFKQIIFHRKSLAVINFEADSKFISMRPYGPFPLIEAFCLRIKRAII
ncbi:MAG TPA: hypothetical protein VLI68_16155, partial [Hanamia sp.]|nr:hypothetical protein [Hanamia sp.]